MIHFSCPACQEPYTAPPESAGKASKCRKCGGKVEVPRVAAESDRQTQLLTGIHELVKWWMTRPIHPARVLGYIACLLCLVVAWVKVMGARPHGLDGIGLADIAFGQFLAVTGLIVAWVADKWSRG